MQLTEKDLPDLAGWQVVKRARNLVAAGSVINANAEIVAGQPCRIKGIVVEGRRRHVSGLTIYSLKEAENHCNCLAARRDGQICEHSIAVALVSLENSHKENTQKSSEVPDNQIKPDKFEWLPIPQFNYELIGQRSIFPVSFSRQDKSPFSTDLQVMLLEAINNLGITLVGDAKPIELTKSGFLHLLAAFKGEVWPGHVEQWPPTRVSSIPSRIPLKATEMHRRQGMVNITVPPLEGSSILFDGINCWILREADHLSIPTNFSGLPQSCRDTLSPLLLSLPNPTSLELEVSWLRDELPNLSDVFHMECSEQLNELLRGNHGTPEVSLEIEGSFRQLDLALSFKYMPGDLPKPGLVEQTFKLLNVGSWQSLSLPDDEQHQRYLAKLIGEKAIMDFYAGNLDRLISLGQWDIQIGKRFAEITKDIEKVRPKLTEAGQGNDWLSFDLEFASSDGQRIPEKEIRRLLATGTSRIRLSGGRRAVFDSATIAELFEVFQDADADADISHPSRRRVGFMHKPLIESYIHEFSSPISLTRLSRPIEDPPSCFNGELREYQKSALAWLYKRVSSGHGAILADEMGLGKTIQILALIALLQEPASDEPENPGNEEQANTCIVVCPTSLILNWQNEIRRFLPTKSVIILHGEGRSKLFSKITECDIVITSYGSLVRDLENYPDLVFRLAIADEASCLKNPQTQVSQTMSMIQACSKIALSGTPMENSSQDIWSILNFTNPGYLESKDTFISRYGSGSEEQMKRLRKRISPFILRRTKAEVASELPSKVEKVIYCELNPEQRRCYEQLINFRLKSFKNIGNSLNDSEQRMEVLLLVLRLRQACCDIRLLSAGRASNTHPINDPKIPSSRLSVSLSENTAIDAEPSSMISAKLLALDKLLKEVINKGGKVLVFSQFVSMLHLIREHLDFVGYKYCYLDGSQPPTQRNQQVEEFQSGDDEIPIFLMSLKAGGYGLTLTQADTVVHFDPWWNPAVEAQATDRAHRIGQLKMVTSYKLIVSGSVEEKILQLQDRKRNMAGVALDEKNPLMESLSADDLEFILS